MYKVFIVDDETVIARGLEKVIDWKQFDCCTYVYSNSINAYESARIEKPQILITDIKMPFMDGLELISKLKNASVRFEAIILSGYSEFEYARKGIDLGVNKYLLKPVEQDKLQVSLIQAIERYEYSILLDNDRKPLRWRADTMTQYSCKESDDIIESIKEYIKVHYTENITLPLLAERFYLNPSYLSHLFKKKTGYTYIHFLTSIRIEKAKALLMEKNKTIAQVCHSVGYENVKHFSRTFEKIVGVRPSVYENT